MLIVSAIKKNATEKKKKIKILVSESLIQGYQLHITERQIKDIHYNIRKHPLNKAKIEAKITCL